MKSPSPPWCKVRSFWEGHKIWKNISLKIWRYWVTSNIRWKIFSNFVPFSKSPNFIFEQYNLKKKYKPLPVQTPFLPSFVCSPRFPPRVAWLLSARLADNWSFPPFAEWCRLYMKKVGSHPGRNQTVWWCRRSPRVSGSGLWLFPAHLFWSRDHSRFFLC